MPSVHPRRMSSYLVVDASAATSVAGGVPVAGFIGEDTIKKRIKVLKPVNKPDDKQKAGSEAESESPANRVQLRRQPAPPPASLPPQARDSPPREVTGDHGAPGGPPVSVPCTLYLIHHSAHPLLPLSFTLDSKPTCSLTSSSRTASTDYCLDRFFWAELLVFFSFSLFFCFWAVR